MASPSFILLPDQVYRSDYRLPDSESGEEEQMSGEQYCREMEKILRKIKIREGGRKSTLFPHFKGKL